MHFHDYQNDPTYTHLNHYRHDNSILNLNLESEMPLNCYDSIHSSLLNRLLSDPSTKHLKIFKKLSKNILENYSLGYSSIKINKHNVDLIPTCHIINHNCICINWLFKINISKLCLELILKNPEIKNLNFYFRILCKYNRGLEPNTGNLNTDSDTWSENQSQSLDAAHDGPVGQFSGLPQNFDYQTRLENQNFPASQTPNSSKNLAATQRDSIKLSIESSTPNNYKLKNLIAIKQQNVTNLVCNQAQLGQYLYLESEKICLNFSYNYLSNVGILNSNELMHFNCWYRDLAPNGSFVKDIEFKISELIVQAT